MSIFDDIKNTLNGIFAVNGDGWVRRKSTSSLDIEICNGEARKDDLTNSCEYCVALNKTVFKNNNKPEYYHINCRCKNEPYNLTNIILDFPMEKITNYLFLNPNKRAMMLSIGYTDNDYEELYNLISQKIKEKFLNGEYKLQVPLTKNGQKFTIYFEINDKKLYSNRTFSCHTGCVAWTNGKIRISTPLILDKEIK